MSEGLVAGILLAYFAALLIISYFTSRNADSNAFFIANKQSPWYLVAFGMIGTSISGLTFISVPGDVGIKSFSYFQLVLGNFVGYMVILSVLMPLYYRLNLISIYTYLDKRYGFWSYKAGAAFFILSRTIGSSLRLYLAVEVLQLFLFDAWNVPFFITGAITILLIWVYTFKGGVKTIIWTDSFQTIFLVSAVIISVYMISQQLGLSLGEMISTVNDSKFSKMFFFGDFSSNKLHFFKQFISGAFIAIVMTGLDQDLMQKNLTCKSIKEAQINMFSFSIIMAIINLLFLTLGALLYIYSEQKGLAIPKNTDHLYPLLAKTEFGVLTGIFFLLGIIASSYASSDSALAALTTSFCIDFLDFKNKSEAVRQRQKLYVHIGFSVLFLIIIVLFREIKSENAITSVLKAAGYTYGPLLGLFSFGVFTKRTIKDNLAPVVCVLAPLFTYLITSNSEELFNYKFSFEILILNGFICFFGLFFISRKGSFELHPEKH